MLPSAFLYNNIFRYTVRTIGISEQSTLYASEKIVIQSSDFPVRCTDSYRHKKALMLPYIET